MRKKDRKEESELFIRCKKCKRIHQLDFDLNLVCTCSTELIKRRTGSVTIQNGYIFLKNKRGDKQEENST